MSSIWVVCPVENFGISGLHFCLGQNADVLTIVFSENGNSGGKKKKLKMLESSFLLFQMKNRGFYFCLRHSQCFLVQTSLIL